MLGILSVHSVLGIRVDVFATAAGWTCRSRF